MRRLDTKSPELSIEELGYTTIEDNFTFFAKVELQQLDLIKNAIGTLFSAAKTNNGDLLLSILIAAEKKPLIYNMEWSSEDKNNATYSNDLKTLASRNSVKLIISAENREGTKDNLSLTLEIDERSKVSIRKWLGENIDYLDTTKHYMKQLFKDCPPQTLIFYPMDQDIFFVCKTDRYTFEYAKQKPQDLNFNAYVDTDHFLLELVCNEKCVATLYVDDKIETGADEFACRIKEDLKKIISHENIFVIVNNQDVPDKTNLFSVKIKNEVKDSIETYISTKGKRL